jgi:phosphatidylserine/phosphatidylglycerophosphate/cardiolipin synthase-like enzyme
MPLRRRVRILSTALASALVPMSLAGAAGASTHTVTHTTHASRPGSASAAPRLASSGQTLITEPGDGLSRVYSLITSAKSTLDMTMYELDDTTVEHDLAADAKRGVKVRVILDTNLEKSNNQAAYTYLSGNGVGVVWADTGFHATHQKSIVVDRRTAAILTLNLTPRYYSTSRDFGIIETDAADVAAIEKVFAADYAHSSVTPGDGDDLVWSPTDSQTRLLALIDSARSSLLIENEEMSDTAVVDALEKAAKKGVDVTVAMTNDDDYYAKEFDALSEDGVHIATYAEDASLYIHAKVIVADYGRSTGEAFLGSENFSSYSLNSNRELGLLTNQASVLSSLESTLTSDYKGGTPWSR